MSRRRSYWQRATPDRRIRFAAIAIVGWVILDIFEIVAEVLHPHGGQALIFLAISSLYFAFFVGQIRRTRREKPS